MAAGRGALQAWGTVSSGATPRITMRPKRNNASSAYPATRGGCSHQLRGGAGLDDLDVTTDAEGNTAIRAGKYISDNVYTDVQVGQDGGARVTLNIDVTPNLTVRGGAGAAGEATVGLFYERDY